MHEEAYEAIESVAKEVNIILRKAHDVLACAREDFTDLLAKVNQEKQFLDEQRAEARRELAELKRRRLVA
jgi:hypothetical protein